MLDEVPYRPAAQAFLAGRSRVAVGARSNRGAATLSGPSEPLASKGSFRYSLPLYRQQERFSRVEVVLPSNGWSWLLAASLRSGTAALKTRMRDRKERHPHP